MVHWYMVPPKFKGYVLKKVNYVLVKNIFRKFLSVQL